MLGTSCGQSLLPTHTGDPGQPKAQLQAPSPAAFHISSQLSCRMSLLHSFQSWELAHPSLTQCPLEPTLWGLPAPFCTVETEPHGQLPPELTSQEEWTLRNRSRTAAWGTEGKGWIRHGGGSRFYSVLRRGALLQGEAEQGRPEDRGEPPAGKGMCPGHQQSVHAPGDGVRTETAAVRGARLAGRRGVLQGCRSGRARGHTMCVRARWNLSAVSACGTCQDLRLLEPERRSCADACQKTEWRGAGV